MKQTYCINLCDILSLLYKKDRKLEEVLAFVAKEKVEYKRIYIGSYFCGKQMLMLREHQADEIAGICREHNMNLTLVIPVFSQGDLEHGKVKIQKLIKKYGELINEVTVNDFGMLHYMSKEYKLNVNLGRMLQKDYREPRFSEYFEQNFKPKVFTQSVKEMIESYPITGLEFDPTHKGLDLSDLPDGVEACIHTPYCYMTVGRICEYASISKSIEEKFRANAPFKEECADKLITYTLDDCEQMFMRVGRTIYFENPDCRVSGVSSLRSIVWPVEMCL